MITIAAAVGARASAAISCRGVFAGPDAALIVHGVNKFDVESLDEDSSKLHNHPVYGHYCNRAPDCTVEVKCHDCVADSAVRQAEDTIAHMLCGCPAPLLQRIKKHQAGLAIIGKSQKTCDIPEFRAHKYDTRAQPSRCLTCPPRAMQARLINIYVLSCLLKDGQG